MGLAPWLLCAAASLQFGRLFPLRSIGRILVVWTGLQAVALAAAAMLLGARSHSAATAAGWAWRLWLWGSAGAIPWLVVFGGISLLHGSSLRRTLVALGTTVILFVVDVGVSARFPFPVLPGAITRVLLSAEPAAGVLAVLCFASLGCVLWRRCRAKESRSGAVETAGRAESSTGQLPPEARQRR